MAKKKQVQQPEETTVDDLIVSEKEIKKRQKEPVDSEAIDEDMLEDLSYHPGTATIEYESRGRFSTPEKVQWKNWTYEHIHNITLSRQEDILEAMVKAFDDMKLDPDLRVQNMTPEEFFETLVALKARYQSKIHKHRWICECQRDVDEKSRKPSEADIDLTTLKYVSIDEAEENLRNSLKKRLSQLDEKTLRSYFKRQLTKTNESDPDAWKKITLDEFLQKVKIKEPFNIESNGKIYVFRWKRVKDLIAAKRIASKEFDSRIKSVRRRVWDRRGSLAEFKENQEKEIERLQEEKGRAIILYSCALSLMKVGERTKGSGEIVFKDLSEMERIVEYKNMDPMVLMSYSQYLEDTAFGVRDERDYTCNLCGSIERGFLQQRSNLLEFLPVNSDSGRDVPESTATFVHFGL